MLDLQDYSVGEILHESAKTLVYRGRRKRDGLPVVLKTLRQDYPEPAALARLRHEFEIARILEIADVVKFLELVEHHNNAVLVEEDFGGQSLQAEMRSRRLDLETFFALAAPLAETLGLLHHEGVIHKDINSSNLVVNLAAQKIKLIDFGIATRLPKEHLSARSSFEGTLAYMSPEQTGRMNRALDYRTDLYSLGVTFYEMLTGQLPFQTDDPAELVHSHIAKTPLPPAQTDAGIPPALSNIVMKLLAKTAEERYQSGFGLQADLQRCRQQWQAQRQIAIFPLGQSDFSERFQIHEKLYGREQESATLLAAFERAMQGRREIMLVCGYAGIGKSSLIHEVHKSLSAQRGYFISGKFDQFQRNVPYFSLIQAFQDLVRQFLTESEAQLQGWREKIQQAVGAGGKVIAQVIPEIELIIGEQPPLPALSPAEAQNRFKLVFQNFVRALPSKERPLVIFLDDLQWADAASLGLLEFLITEAVTPYFLGIGAYRDNEVGPAHPLMLTIEAIEKAGVSLTRLVLQPLKLEHVSQLLSDALHGAPAQVRPLAELVMEKTQGNPFFVNQFLRSLYEEKLLTPEAAQQTWHWDVKKIRALGITDNVVELMTGKLKKLRPETQQALKLAACIGSPFDLRTLATVHAQTVPETAAALSEAVAEGLIIPLGDFGMGMSNFKTNAPNESAPMPIYKFAHDRIQQAAYTLISEAEKKNVHWQIGQLLLQKTPAEQREQKIFDIVNQLNLGSEKIAAAAERLELAALNLGAGGKAKLSAAYEPAFKYLQAGLGLLREEDWGKQYELALSLHVETAEAAYLAGDYAGMEKLVAVALQRAQTALDRVKIYEVKIQACMAQSQYDEVIRISLVVLKMLGVRFPAKPNILHTVFELIKAKIMVSGKRIEKLNELPPMTDPLKLAAMRTILIHLGTAAYWVRPGMLALTVLKPLNLSVKYGNSPISPSAYIGYAVILNAKLGEISAGYRFGRLGLRVLESLHAKGIEAREIFLFNALIRHWTEDARESLPLFLQTYRLGLETGDLQYAALSMYSHFLFSYFSGKNLAALEQERTKYTQALSPLKQKSTLLALQIAQQALLNFMGRVENPGLLKGEVFDEEAALPELLKMNDTFALYDVCVHKSQLCYHFGAYAEALENLRKAEKYLDAMGAIDTAVNNMYNSLARIALLPQLNGREKRRYLQKVRTNQKKMRQWATQAPMNYQHRFELVEAERRRVLGDDLQAMALYDRAIMNARKSQYLHEEALANELAAKFHLAGGREKIARDYLLEARYLYQQWGGRAKVQYLEKIYNALLPETAAASDGQEATANPRAGTASGGGGALDLLSVLKATQAIAGEIDLAKLLAKMITIVIENAGAQRGCFLIESDGEWLIEAEGFADQSAPRVLQSQPLGETVAASLVHYVSRTRETVVLADAAREGRFAHDAYVQQRGARSLLCKAVIKQNDLIGMLYLENDLSADVFVPDRLEALEILSAQIAVSFENARLYKRLEQYNRTLEDKVQQRTAELQEKNAELTQTLQRLRDTQNQLVTQEKLASLGQLTAGIAHEIKNPLNFVNNFAVLSVDLAKELQEKIEKRKAKSTGRGTKSEGREENGEVGDDFTSVEEIIQTLIQNAEKINYHGKRADGIVKSMMQHARGSSGQREMADINHLLDEAVNLVYHGLRANDVSFNVTIEKEYDDSIGKLEVVPQDLSRVFLNIVNNAAYAAHQKKCENRGDFSPTLSVATKNLGDKIEIRIRDNGNGIPAEVREKIFNPFFTTKPTGQGTGLGLSISYDIIVQQHRGEIKVETEKGKFTEFIVQLPRS